MGVRDRGKTRRGRERERQQTVERGSKVKRGEGRRGRGRERREEEDGRGKKRR